MHYKLLLDIEIIIVSTLLKLLLPTALEALTLTLVITPSGMRRSVAKSYMRSDNETSMVFSWYVSASNPLVHQSYQ